MATLADVLATQPFKTLYVVASTLVRQHPTWGFGQALALCITRAFITTVSVVRARTPLPLTPEKEGARFEVISHRAAHAGARYPIRLAPADVTADTRVLLHMHGGAYVFGDGRTAASGYLAHSLLQHTPVTHVLCPQYRLSTLPAGPRSNPFLALQDALTAYLFVLHELKVPADSVVLGGDSASGNCAIALLRYIAEYGAELAIPPPGAALLWSPWIDHTDGSTEFARTNPHFACDYVVLASITCVGGGFQTLVLVYVNVGGAEVLYFVVKEWAEMREAEGNEVCLDITEGIYHDLLIVARTIGMEDKAVEMAKSAGAWLADVGNR
ncbi:alpha/beta-hydrolase [Karstenula rhodostoma CBS 690.94]|uniref:Alpha/beta-hydrolase n=1 Tax=Karstenula rhodostoma CBS 690.94 TaxID=1392251 RepID=A0A9P4U4Q9_9PLEO|nr:alpha/beta-hydrolase [Karstenula rhodostoma CBS 690.94]